MSSHSRLWVGYPAQKPGRCSDAGASQRFVKLTEARDAVLLELSGEAAGDKAAPGGGDGEEDVKRKRPAADGGADDTPAERKKAAAAERARRREAERVFEEDLRRCEKEAQPFSRRAAPSPLEAEYAAKVEAFVATKLAGLSGKARRRRRRGAAAPAEGMSPSPGRRGSARSRRLEPPPPQPRAQVRRGLRRRRSQPARTKHGTRTHATRNPHVLLVGTTFPFSRECSTPCGGPFVRTAAGGRGAREGPHGAARVPDGAD